MKRFLRLLTLAGAVAGAVWYARQNAEPQPAPADGEWMAKPDLKAVADPPEAPPESVVSSAIEGAPAEEKPADDLTDIKGIGPKYSAQLHGLGISSFADLAGADPAEVSASFDARADVEGWITQARQRMQA